MADDTLADVDAVAAGARAEEVGDGADGPSDDSLIADARALADDVRTAVEAEVAYQSARAGFLAGGGRAIALCFALAALLAVIALCTLAIGVLMALTPAVGPWLATAIVVAALVAAALVLALGANRRLRRLTAAAFPPAREPQA